MHLTLLHSEWSKLQSFGHSECNRVNYIYNISISNCNEIPECLVIAGV